MTNVEVGRDGGCSCGMDTPARSSPLLPVLLRGVSVLDGGAAPMRGEDGRLRVVDCCDCADIGGTKAV